MKRILKTMLIVAMAVCLVGCGTTEETEGTSVTNTPAPTNTIAPTESVFNDTTIAVNEGEFKVGSYAGTATYAEGEFSMTWNFIVNYDADGKFILKNDIGEEKGTGTYTLTDNYYTMTYDDNRTCIFVVQKDGTLNVIEPLPYGQATIDPEKVGELVLSYMGELSVDSEQKEDNTEEGTTTVTGNFIISAGTYRASYIKESAMAGKVEYIYLAEVGADGTFSYQVSFDMGDKTYDGSAASGTYTIDGNKFVFTDSEGNVVEGTVIADNTLLISLMASSMAKEPYEVTFVIE